MNSTAMAIILYAGTGICIALVLLAVATHGRERPANPLYKTPFFWLSIDLLSIQLRFALIFTGPAVDYPLLVFGHITSIYLTPILLLWLLSQVLDMDKPVPPRLYHIGWAFAGLAFLAEVYLFFHHQANPGTLLYDSVYGEKWMITHGVILPCMLVFALYGIFLGRRIKQAYSLFLVPHKSMITLFTTMLTINIGTLFFGFVVRNPLVFEIACVLHAGLQGFYLYFVGRFPDFLAGLKIEVERQKYANTPLSGIDVSGIKQRIEQLMDSDGLFLDENLRIQQMADRLGLSINQLSRILNEEYGRNFSEFVNGYRIDRAKHLLIKEPKAAIIDIVYRTGFSSKSAFNRQFLRQTGMQPSEFRQQQNG